MLKKRRRFKQTLDLSARLIEDVEQLKSQLEKLPPGPERDRIVKRIRQNETARDIDQWLASPGLQPPHEVKNLSK